MTGPQRSLVAVLIASTAAAEPMAPGHDLLPVPVSLTWGTGALRIGPGFELDAPPPCDERVRRALVRFQAAAAPDARLAGAKTPSRHGLRVVCDGSGDAVPRLGEDESYALVVGPDAALLRAPSSAGALNGLETLRQLVRVDGVHREIPAVTITDRPRFPWRGLLLDAVRHFMPVDVVRRTLDGMAAVKLNVFHWHLTDDQGFRVESRRFPRFTEVASDGQFYTQAEIRELVAYAADRGIRVVPEFDVPGHATAWLVAYPELATLPGPYTLERRWGIFDPTLDPSRVETVRFLEALFEEMVELFPDSHLHIGGDEVSGRHWNESARVRRFAHEADLADNAAVQADFNRRIANLLAARGRTVVGWDDMLHDTLPRSAVIQSYRGARSMDAAVHTGFPALLSSGYYLDFMQSAGEHYAVDPVPDGLRADATLVARVLGGEACMWSEYVDARTVDSRIWPRAAAIAERLWSPAHVRDETEMYRRLEIASQRLEARGLTHRRSLEPMLAELLRSPAVAELKRLVEVVEPVRLYARSASRAYTQSTPLDRLVDAARPDSPVARTFARDVEAYLAQAPRFGPAPELRARLSSWATLHEALDLRLARFDHLAEVRPVSRSLARLATAGLEALDHLAAGREPDHEWRNRVATVLASSAAPAAEVEIAVRRPIHRLVAAALRLAELGSTDPRSWLERIRLDVEPDPASR